MSKIINSHSLKKKINVVKYLHRLTYFYLQILHTSEEPNHVLT